MKARNVIFAALVLGFAGGAVAGLDGQCQYVHFADEFTDEKAYGVTTWAAKYEGYEPPVLAIGCTEKYGCNMTIGTLKTYIDGGAHIKYRIDNGKVYTARWQGNGDIVGGRFAKEALQHVIAGKNKAVFEVRNDLNQEK